MSKKRLDNLLTGRGLVPSRSKAQALIITGDVFVEGVKTVKPGAQVEETATITLKERAHNYVSRGGVKLAHALGTFGIDPAGLVCVDVGASTGGFTDCLLGRGAAKVWAIDVGRNQLHYALRKDERVVCLEGVNAREIDPAIITDPVEMMVADVSFISLRLVIPPLLPCLTPGARVLPLVKPQFEAGRDKVGKGGVVRDPEVHRDVIDGLTSFFEKIGFECGGECASPLLGPKGNVEYFLNLAWPKTAFDALRRKADS